MGRHPVSTPKEKTTPSSKRRNGTESWSTSVPWNCLVPLNRHWSPAVPPKIGTASPSAARKASRAADPLTVSPSGMVIQRLGAPPLPPFPARRWTASLTLERIDPATSVETDLATPDTAEKLLPESKTRASESSAKRICYDISPSVVQPMSAIPGHWALICLQHNRKVVIDPGKE